MSHAAEQLRELASVVRAAQRRVDAEGTPLGFALADELDRLADAREPAPPPADPFFMPPL